MSQAEDLKRRILKRHALRERCILEDCLERALPNGLCAKHNHDAGRRRDGRKLRPFARYYPRGHQNHR